MPKRSTIAKYLSFLLESEDGRTNLSKLLEGELVKDWKKFDEERASAGRGDGSSKGLKAGDPGKGLTKDFAGEHLVAGQHSLSNCLEADGKGGWRLNPEAQGRLDERIKEVTSGVPKSSDPTLHMLGGGPAAGKSTVTNNPEFGVPNTDPSKGEVKAVLVNADDEKAANPTYQKMMAEGDPKAAAFCHEESSFSAKQIQAAAMAQGKDIVLDGTGNSKQSSIEGKIDTAHEQGYKVAATYVTCPTDEAVARATSRGERTGRVVPEGTIRDTHASVSAILPAVASKFDSMKLVDTTSGPGEVIASATKGGEVQVSNPTAYKTFTDKANEGSRS